MPINSYDNNLAATITLTSGKDKATVRVTDSPSDVETAVDLIATTFPLTGANIGSRSAGDSSVHVSGDWWIDGSGAAGIKGAADSFHFESQAFTGDFQMIVQLNSLTALGATAPLAGLMVRDGTAAGSRFLALAGQSATSGDYDLVERTTVNKTTLQTMIGAPLSYTYPNAWMMLSRSGNVLHAYVSSDGVNFTEVTNPATGVTWTGMGAKLNIGLFSASASTFKALAIMSNFSITAPADFTRRGDIGKPGKAGSASVAGSSISISASGTDIWNKSDQFNFYSSPLDGTSQSLIVHVDSPANTDPQAKAGVMFRNSSTATSPFVALYELPNLQVSLQWRDKESTAADCPTIVSVGDTTSAKWLKLTMSGSTFTAYYATTVAAPGLGRLDFDRHAFHGVPQYSLSGWSGRLLS